MKEDNEELLMTFDPSKDEVLGVFDDLVHVKTIDCIFIIDIDLYHNTWHNWLMGKSNICNHYGYYCGVGGYTVATQFEILDPIELNEYIPDEEEGYYITTSYAAFLVTKFDEYHDFEHG